MKLTNRRLEFIAIVGLVIFFIYKTTQPTRYRRATSWHYYDVLHSLFTLSVILFTIVLSALWFWLIETFIDESTLIHSDDLDNKLWLSLVKIPPKWITSVALTIGRSIWLLPALRAIQLGYEFFITQNHVSYLRALGLLGELLICFILGALVMSTPDLIARKYNLRWIKKMNELITLELKRLRREYEAGKVSICDLYLLEAFHYGKANISRFADFKKLADKTTDPRDRWKLFDAFFRGPTSFFSQHNVKIPPGIIPSNFNSLQNEYFFWFWETAIDSFLKAHPNIDAPDCQESLSNFKESWRHLRSGLFGTINDRNAELVDLCNKLRHRLSRDAGWSDEAITDSFL